jgi:hypothetical protein
VARRKPLITAGVNPVVFCRFIATADHVAAGLRKAFPKLRIETVTGALTPEDRRARVDDMAEAEQRLLVATVVCCGWGWGTAAAPRSAPRMPAPATAPQLVPPSPP